VKGLTSYSAHCGPPVSRESIALVLTIYTEKGYSCPTPLWGTAYYL